MAEPLGRRVRVVVVTPERALVDKTCDFVALPLYDGELGVLPGRAPLIGRLGYGELRCATAARSSASSWTAASCRYGPTP